MSLALECLPERAADAFETGLDHVVSVLTLDRDMNRAPKSLAQGAKEMRNEFGWKGTDSVARKLPGEGCEGPSGEINCDLRRRFIHRQH